MPVEATQATTFTYTLTPRCVDFSKTPLNVYTDLYAKVVDDVFTPSECASLISLASSSEGWKPAALHYGLEPSQQYLNSSVRHNERILRFDSDTADKIYARLLPLVQDMADIRPGGKWEGITMSAGQGKGSWKLVGVNERLSFLRYGPGNFFKPHYDGQVDLPDGRKSRVTLQVYLNDEGLSGGATRFWSPDMNHFWDVDPKIGRVLVFQQRGMLHSGEEVRQGIKYTLRSDFMFEVVAGDVQDDRDVVMMDVDEVAARHEKPPQQWLGRFSLLPKP